MPRAKNEPTATDLALALGESHEDSLIQLYADESSPRSLLRTEVHQWPSNGATSDLATFATNRRAYTAFMAYIANGVRLATAARAVGILHKRITNWLQKGCKHTSQNTDSVFSWFYMDCYQARGASMVKAEIAAYRNDPQKFVERMDSGGQFNPTEGIGLDAIFRLEESSIEQSETNSIEASDVAEAFVALATKGITNLESIAKEAKSQVPSPNGSDS